MADSGGSLGHGKGVDSPSHSSAVRGTIALSLTLLLIQACASGDLVAVANLVSGKHADPFADDGTGHTPLAAACEAGHIEVVKFIMGRAGAREAVLRCSKTPLHIAARAGHVELAKFLVDEMGMDTSLADQSGRTPLDYAQNREMREFLLSCVAIKSQSSRPPPVEEFHQESGRFSTSDSAEVCMLWSYSHAENVLF